MAACNISPDDTRIDVVVSWVEREMIRMVPGAKWDSHRKLWHLPLSWGSCIALRGVFRDNLDIGIDLVRWAQQERGVRIDQANALRTVFDWEGEKLDDRLFGFQEVGHRFMTTAHQALLGDEMGTGKTCQSIMTLRSLGDDALPALVITPNSVKHQWADESDLWKSGATPYVITGPAGKRRKLFEEAAEDPYALVIINIEAVRIHSKLAPYGSVRLLKCIECGGQDPDFKDSRCEKHPKELNGIPFRTVIIDEAHRLKDPKSKQTRACWAVGHGPTVEYRYALSGTPVAEHPGDLWPIMHFLAPLDFPTRQAYIDRYCLVGWNSFGALEILGLRPDTKEEFFQIINPRFRRTPKSLVLSQLPEKTYVRREVDLTTKQRKAYDEIESTLITRLDDGRRVVSSNSLTANTRLIQLSSAYFTIIDEEFSSETGLPKIRLCNPSPKIDLLEEICDELEGKQFVVCAESRQLIELAAERLEKKLGGDQVVQITGAVPDGIRKANLSAFQNGRARVLMFTVKAGGVGLNMTAADTLIRLQRSWSMIDNRQAVDRVHRIGSEKHDKILIIDIVARDTVEDDQLRRLYVKQARLEEIVRDKATLTNAGYSIAHLEAEEIALLGGDLYGREELGI